MTAGSGISSIAAETVPARSSEVGRRPHRAAFGKPQVDAAQGGEAGVDGAAQISGRWRFADRAPEDVAGFFLYRAAVTE